MASAENYPQYKVRGGVSSPKPKPKAPQKPKVEVEIKEKKKAVPKKTAKKKTSK